MTDDEVLRRIDDKFARLEAEVARHVDLRPGIRFSEHPPQASRFLVWNDRMEWWETYHMSALDESRRREGTWKPVFRLWLPLPGKPGEEA